MKKTLHTGLNEMSRLAVFMRLGLMMNFSKLSISSSSSLEPQNGFEPLLFPFFWPTDRKISPKQSLLDLNNAKIFENKFYNLIEQSKKAFSSSSSPLRRTIKAAFINLGGHFDTSVPVAFETP